MAMVVLMVLLRVVVVLMVLMVLMCGCATAVRRRRRRRMHPRVGVSQAAGARPLCVHGRVFVTREVVQLKCTRAAVARISAVGRARAVAARMRHIRIFGL